MLSGLKNSNGFTLIELLIVVSLIGVLAAIAIPQYSSYRIKGFNSAAASDLVNLKTVQEALFSAHQTYGVSETAVTLVTLSGAGGVGNLVTSSESAATISSAGSVLAGLSPANIKAGLGIGVSNGVCFYATTVPGAGSNAYVMVTKHTKGNRVFVSESASQTNKYVQNDIGGVFEGVQLAVGGFPAAGIPAAASALTTITSATLGNGSPNPNWAEM